jgi:RNA polymerase sigma-70 factor, ECF subfamily
MWDWRSPFTGKLSLRPARPPWPRCSWGGTRSPTQAAQRAERMLRVQGALNTLDPIDREVLALRHFEQLSRAETAEVLGISPEAGAKRYFRALKRLKEVLASMPGGWEGI